MSKMDDDEKVSYKIVKRAPLNRQPENMAKDLGDILESVVRKLPVQQRADPPDRRTQSSGARLAERSVRTPASARSFERR